MDKHFNIIPGNTYADNLLLNVLALNPAMLIMKDTYAEDLLYNIGETKAIKILPFEKIIPINGNTPE